jgi:predicted nucleotidyltransferase
MIDIAELKPLIVERLKSLNPDKIILFGSFAYGTPNENSDIDLFLVKDDEDNNIEAKALVKLRDLMKKYAIGFDILSASSQFLEAREDPFYKHDVLSKGKVLYG